MFSNNPFETIDTWLKEELEAGAPNPKQGVLSTSTVKSIPHSRVVAVREISKDGLIFFTQSGTRKVVEMKENPIVSFTFWFELRQREIILEGDVVALSEAENQKYWDEYPKEAQIRFYSYAPTSSDPIGSKVQLESIRSEVRNQYMEECIPLSPYYRGFRIIPKRIIFYAYQLDELSDVKEYSLKNQVWTNRTLSP